MQLLSLLDGVFDNLDPMVHIVHSKDDVNIFSPITEPSVGYSQGKSVFGIGYSVFIWSKVDDHCYVVTLVCSRCISIFIICFALISIWGIIIHYIGHLTWIWICFLELFDVFLTTANKESISYLQIESNFCHCIWSDWIFRYDNTPTICIYFPKIIPSRTSYIH